MNSKKIISLFLFLVLSIQVLPLKQIASWLSSAAMSEEIPGELSTIKGKSAGGEFHSDFQNFQSFELNANSYLIRSNHNHDESLFIRHPDDVITPPPNYLPFPA